MPSTSALSVPKVKVEEFAKYIQNKSDLYEACLRNDWYLPKYKSSMVTEAYLKNVMIGKTLCPRYNELKPKPCPRPPYKQILIDKFLAAATDKGYQSIGMDEDHLPDKRWLLDVLAKLIESYNGTYHRSIKMSPDEVSRENEALVWRRLYNPDDNEPVKFKFDVGDRVRISKNKPIFEKGYTPNWTEELFEISERIPKSPPVYRIKDENNRIIKGTFYEKELQKINHDDTYRIAEVLQTRFNRRLGYEESLVSWLGYTEDFNSWVRSSEIVNIAVE